MSSSKNVSQSWEPLPRRTTAAKGIQIQHWLLIMSQCGTGQDTWYSSVKSLYSSPCWKHWVSQGLLFQVYLCENNVRLQLRHAGGKNATFMLSRLQISWKQAVGPGSSAMLSWQNEEFRCSLVVPADPIELTNPPCGLAKGQLNKGLVLSFVSQGWGHQQKMFWIKNAPFPLWRFEDTAAFQQSQNMKNKKGGLQLCNCPYIISI